MAIIAGFLAAALTFGIVTALLSAVAWIFQAVILYRVAKKYEYAHRWLVFLPPITFGYFAMMAGVPYIVFHAVAVIILILSGFYNNYYIFYSAAALFYVSYASTCWRMLRSDKRMLVLSLLAPPLLFIAINKVYLKRKEI